MGFSPLLDLDLGTNPDRCSRSDAYLPMRKMARLVPLLNRGPVPLRGARKAADVDSDAFPPTVIITAENEMLEADVVELIERLDEAGVEAVAHSYAWQIHAFPIMNARHAETLHAVEVTAAFTTQAVREAKADADRDIKAVG